MTRPIREATRQPPRCWGGRSGRIPWRRKGSYPSKRPRGNGQMWCCGFGLSSCLGLVGLGLSWVQYNTETPSCQAVFFGKLAREPQQLPHQVTNLLRKIVTHILMAFLIRWYFDYLTFQLFCSCFISASLTSCSVNSWPFLSFGLSPITSSHGTLIRQPKGRHSCHTPPFGPRMWT